MTATAEPMEAMFGLPATESQTSQPQKPETAIAKVEPKPTTIAAGERGLKLTNLDEAWRFAGAVARSGLAPRDMNTQDKILIALQFGAEVGLSPMQSLQSIAVINGKPSMYGDALPALVYSSGICDGVIKEWIEGEGDKMTAHCEAKRKDSPDVIRRSFSVADAKTAGLWDKAGPWKQYPKRMLTMRARAFCLRDGFADVLRGMQVREELEDYPPRAEHTADETLPLDDAE